MRVEELRIGNLIEHNYFSSPPVTITGLKKDKGTDLVYISDPTFNTINIEQVKPIPLTEEWLLRFGFEETTDKGLILYYELSSGAYLEKVGEVLRLFDRGGYMLSHDNLKHVHQLQNLYFALTSEELTIK